HRTKEADADDLAATTSPSVRDHSVSRDDSCSPEDAPFFHPSRAIEPRSSPANPNGSGPTGPRAHRDGRFCLYCVERPGSALERFVSSSLVSTGSCRPFFRYVLDNREVMRTLRRLSVVLKTGVRVPVEEYDGHPCPAARSPP